MGVISKIDEAASDIPWSESLKSILTGAPHSKLGRLALVYTLAQQIRNRMKVRLPNLFSGYSLFCLKLGKLGKRKKINWNNNMKEDGRERNRRNARSEFEKERTKIRERKRRSITSKIFHGLREHGGYRLSPRADINQVLRHLAQEAGWVVEPDGTTYRSTSITTATSSCISVCQLCGGGRNRATPTGSSMGANAAIGSGECSTIGDPTAVHHSSPNLPFYCGCGPSSSSTTLAVRSSCSSHHDAMPQMPSITTSIVFQKGQLYSLPVAQESNQNSPMESAQYRT
ncbi:unnamed protein product [Fraxinus pennsylvanica]|uniref:Protein BZR1 homolog n=1 Tax=Fraxinus pennsylvanica TaxID=56036 RepID=A0AAD2A8I0_9LAMI|nr:unnamed protein product [Fraxinus pennsylvanica]